MKLLDILQKGNIDHAHHVGINVIRLSKKQIASAINISRERFQNILLDELSMTQVSTGWV